MPKLVLTNARIFAGGADLTGQSNKLEVAVEVEEKDVTNFGSNGWHEGIGGLISSSLSAEGHWEAGDASKVDDQMWGSLGNLEAWSVGPNGANVGDLAYLTKFLTASYKQGGEVGEVAPWSADAKGEWPMPRGVFAHPPGTARTATGTGTGQQIGAVATGKNFYSALHVLSVAGTTPSITVEIESDDNSGFTTPTTRLSFTAANAIGDQISRVAGAITDTWWRPKWTISGTTPSFLFVVSFGIW